MKFKFIYTFFAFLLFSVFLEISAHYLFRIKNGNSLAQSFMYIKDDRLGYLLNNNYQHDSVKFYNGFKTYPFLYEKSKTVKRICCLGSSTTFGGSESPLQDTYPAHLEKYLNKYSLDVEVINMGISAFGTSQILKLMETDIKILQPDMIIINAIGSILGCLDSNRDWMPENIITAKRSLKWNINAFLINHSVIYIQLKKILTKVIIRNLKYANCISSLTKSEIARQNYNLERIFKIADSLEIKLYVIDYPVQDTTDSEYRQGIDLIRQSCRQNQINLIDCSSIFNLIPFHERTKYFIDMYHLTSLGNEKIAMVIYQKLTHDEK